MDNDYLRNLTLTQSFSIILQPCFSNPSVFSNDKIPGCQSIKQAFCISTTECSGITQEGGVFKGHQQIIKELWLVGGVIVISPGCTWWVGEE